MRGAMLAALLAAGNARSALPLCISCHATTLHASPPVARGLKPAKPPMLQWEGFMGACTPALLFRSAVNIEPSGVERQEVGAWHEGQGFRPPCWWLVRRSGVRIVNNVMRVRWKSEV